MDTQKKKSVKFGEKYGVRLASVYQGDPDRVKVPPLGHVLFDPSSPTAFDELTVAEIDRDGNMNSAVEVWSDPDSGTLWIVDGRGRQLATDECNRRRRAEKRDPVELQIVRFVGTEQDAIRRIQVKNFHRRGPTHSGMAFAIVSMRKAGHSWDACASGIHVTTDDAEQFCRRLIPIAFCIEEVRALIDAGKLAKGKAVKFGGRALDGSDAKGREEQLALLAAEMEPAAKDDRAPTPRLPTPRALEAMRGAVNGEVIKAAHLLAFIAGDGDELKQASPKLHAALVAARDAASKPGRKKAVES